MQLILEAKKNNNKQLKFLNKGDQWPKKLVFNDYVLSNRFPIMFSLIMKKLCLFVLILLQTD